jgi:hypothetical protein
MRIDSGDCLVLAAVDGLLSLLVNGIEDVHAAGFHYCDITLCGHQLGSAGQI